MEALFCIFAVFHFVFSRYFILYFRGVLFCIFAVFCFVFLGWHGLKRRPMPKIKRTISKKDGETLRYRVLLS